MEILSETSFCKNDWFGGGRDADIRAERDYQIKNCEIFIRMCDNIHVNWCRSPEGRYYKGEQLTAGFNYHTVFCVCPVCDKVGVSPDGDGMLVCTHDYPRFPIRTYHHKRLIDAAEKANRFKFL